MNATKEHILKTSLALFLQKSYKEVTMKEIVKTTGLSKGAFYHYFTGKEQLFKEIVNMFFSMGAIDYTSFPKDSLERFYNRYIAHIENSFQQIEKLTDPSKESASSLNVFLILFEAISRFPEFLTLEKEMYQQEVKEWERIIRHASRTGEISTESDERSIADLFLYCTDGVFIRYANKDEKGSYASYLKKSFDTIYQNLKT